MTKFIDLIKSQLNYDESTGKFTWKVSNSNRIKVGESAGSLNSNGYITIRINGKLYFAHRLAWMIFHGYESIKEIDHIDGCRYNNKISNLRECTSAQNKWNQTLKSTNKSGVKGVCWNKRRNKWMARIGANGKEFFVGYFDSLSEAEVEILRYRKSLHGEFYKST